MDHSYDMQRLSGSCLGLEMFYSVGIYLCSGTPIMDMDELLWNMNIILNNSSTGFLMIIADITFIVLVCELQK